MVAPGVVIASFHWHLRPMKHTFKIESFQRKVKKSRGCWLWTGAVNRGGYGVFRTRERSTTAHRISWEMHFGEISEGLCVLHHCDNRGCVRPSHLWLGTKTDNNIDRDIKGRHTRLQGMSHGMAKLTDDDVREIRRRCTGRYGSMAKLGREFGVTSAQIGHIHHRRQWRHVPDEPEEKCR